MSAAVPGGDQESWLLLGEMQSGGVKVACGAGPALRATWPVVPAQRENTPQTAFPRNRG